MKKWWINYNWKFWFRFLSISLYIKIVSKKIWHSAQSTSRGPCLGSYIFVSVNTKYNIFFPSNQCCLFIKWKVEARITLLMQNSLSKIVVQSNSWTICNFSFRQKTAVLIWSGFGPGGGSWARVTGLSCATFTKFRYFQLPFLTLQYSWATLRSRKKKYEHCKNSALLW